MSGQCFLHATHGEHCDVIAPVAPLAERTGSVWTFSTSPTGQMKLHHVLPPYKKLVTIAASTTTPRNPASHTSLPLVATSRNVKATIISPSWTSTYRLAIHSPILRAPG